MARNEMEMLRDIDVVNSKDFGKHFTMLRGLTSYKTEERLESKGLIEYNRRAKFGSLKRGQWLTNKGRRAVRLTVVGYQNKFFVK